MDSSSASPPARLLSDRAGPFDIAMGKVMAERARQKRIGYSEEHDDEHDKGEVAAGAAAYALAAADLLHPQSQGDAAFSATVPPPMWPEHWTFKPGTPERMLVKAAAMCIAELERMYRNGTQAR